MIKHYVNGKIFMSSHEYESVMKKIVPSSDGGQITRIGPPVVGTDDDGRRTVSFDYVKYPGSGNSPSSEIDDQWELAADTSNISIPKLHLTALLNGIENNRMDRENADGTPTAFFVALDYLKFLLRNGGQS